MYFYLFTYLLPTKLNNIMYFLAKSQPLKKSDYKDIMATLNPTTRILISIVYSMYYILLSLRPLSMSFPWMWST